MKHRIITLKFEVYDKSDYKDVELCRELDDVLNESHTDERWSFKSELLRHSFMQIVKAAIGKPDPLLISAVVDQVETIGNIPAKRTL